MTSQTPAPLDPQTLEALVRALEEHSNTALQWANSPEAEGFGPLRGARLPACPSCGARPRTVVQRFADVPNQMNLTFDECGHTFSAGKAEITAAIRGLGA